MLARQETLGLGPSETKELLVALRAFRKGDLAARLPADWQGLAGKVADAFNDLADMGDRMTKEVDRVGQVIGKEGKVVGPAQVEGVSGTWKNLTDTINQMIATLSETIGNSIEQARLVEEHRLKVEIKSREVEEARSALEGKAEQLALASRYKSEFLANMSHELRTPLNSLLILSQLLTDDPEGNLSDKQKGFAHTIHSSGGDLLALINDILDLSKIESGTVTVEVANVPLAEVRDQVEQMFRHVAQPRNLAFAIHIDPRLPRAIRTDPKRLLRVIKNLLGNAFKFTAKGGINLRVEPASGGWSLDHEILNRARQVIAFTVADTGIGIPPEKQKIVFEAFQQGDGSTGRRYGGTGLGLAISREVATLLGGELRLVSSLVDRGSAFTFFLPIEYEPPLKCGVRNAECGMKNDKETDAAVPLFTPHSAIRIPHSSAALKDKVVLIVDDDARNLLALSALLQCHEVKVLTAGNGKDALEALARGDGVDIILMDIMMPQMDGYATIAALRQMPRFKGVPIIALTAKAMKGDREKCLSAGASDYIAKPVDPDQLLSLLHGCLYR